MLVLLLSHPFSRHGNKGWSGMPSWPPLCQDNNRPGATHWGSLRTLSQWRGCSEPGRVGGERGGTAGLMRCPLAALACRAQREGLQSLVSWGTGVDQCPETSLHLLPVSPRLYPPETGGPEPQATQALTPVALCDPMDCNVPGFPLFHYLLELAQTHIHGVSDAIQPPHPWSPPSPPAFHLSQHQGLFQ